MMDNLLPAGWLIYDHYLFAIFALVGTLWAIWAIFRVTHRQQWWPILDRWTGIVGPFINVISVLFGLTIAFIADDTWTTRDRAVTTVYREADSLRSLAALAQVTPLQLRMPLCQAIGDYAQGSAREWRYLKRRSHDPAVRRQADLLVIMIASPAMSSAVSTPVQNLMLQEIKEIRNQRDLRISLSQTHVNPVKWLSMAFLGFLTLCSLAVVHLERSRAALLSMILFGLAAAPTAAVILIQSNPFRQPIAVKPKPIALVRCESLNE